MLPIALLHAIVRVDRVCWWQLAKAGVESVDDLVVVFRKTHLWQQLEIGIRLKVKYFVSVS